MRKLSYKGFSAVEGLLIMVIIAALGFVGWYVWHNKAKPTSESQSTTPTSAVPTTTAPSTTKTADPYAGWKTFTSKLGKVTLRYPKDWKAEGELATSYNPESTPVEQYAFTAPSGVSVTYVLTDKQSKVVPYTGQYEKNSCGTQSECPVIIVSSITKISLKNFGEVQLVRMGNNKRISEGNYSSEPGYSTVLDVPDSAQSTYKVGQTKLGMDMILPSILKGRNVYYFTANYPKSYSSKTADQVYSTPDSKMAELILKSITFE